MHHVTVKKKDEFTTLRRVNRGHLITGLLQCKSCERLVFVRKIYHCIIDTSPVILLREYGNIAPDAYYMTFSNQGQTRCGDVCISCQIKSLGSKIFQKTEWKKKKPA